LASWININRGPYVIPPEQSKEIPFFVEVPENASPGGHFAAALIGTEPPETDNKLIVRTSQIVTSLFFARIEGDIIEEAVIREFSVVKSFVEEPEVDFSLRFENKGNVHLIPRGVINITNMWGKERGVIPINQKTLFGNVLPDSIRDFKFSWKGEKSITEIGRYKAEVTLAYGKDGIKNISAVTYFWVIPVKGTLVTLAFVIGFLLFITWAIKLYIRRMLALAGVNTDTMNNAGTAHTIVDEDDIRLSSYKKVSAPIRKGALDLRMRLSGVREIFEFIKTIFKFIRNYKIFFSAVTILVVGFVAVVLYISDVSTDQKGYEVTIDRVDGSTTVNSEEVIKEQLQGDASTILNPNQHFELFLYNESGEVGVAANAAILLEETGYVVTALETNLDTSREKTVIVYDTNMFDEASALSVMFGNALLSSSGNVTGASSTDSVSPKIKVFFGSDQLE